jgi:hypothetical protein
MSVVGLHLFVGADVARPGWGRAWGPLGATDVRRGAG